MKFYNTELSDDMIINYLKDGIRIGSWNMKKIYLLQILKI